MADATSISSTSHLAEEKAREAAQRRASQERAQSIRRNLLDAGRERATEYGRLLFREHVETITDALDALFGRMVRGDAIAGPHYCAVPALLVFREKGLQPVAALAMGVVLDRLSSRRSYKEVAQAIGREIEDEARALGIEAKDRDLLRILKKRAAGRRKAVVGEMVLRQLHLSKEPWSHQDRFHVGALLLDLVIAHTGLLKATPRLRGKDFDLEPTTAVLELIKANPPRPIPVRRLPMLVEPRPWPGLYGGGHLDSSEPLVGSRKPLDLTPYKTNDISTQLRVVNALQRQTMAIDPWMVEQQRQAWDCNIRGLFPVQRDPMPVPPQPEPGSSKEEWAEWKKQQAAAWLDERTGKQKRVRIEEGIRQCEAIAGRPVWFAYDLDFRGRVYSSNRYVTHQGPDDQKGAVAFAHGEPCDEEAFEWLLKAAAGHWGLGKAKWDERLTWGKQNLDLLTAAAEAPLDRLELWRGAADPWQFLQAARAVRQWLQDPSAAITCPARFDQTCSGVGISAALLRDQRLARHTNLIGSTRHDIYQVVADRVTLLLRQEIELAGPVACKHAVFWLDFGIERNLMKAPVMTSVYGASYQSLVDGLTDALQERRGQADLWRLQGDVLSPVRYLVKVVNEALELEVGPCLELQRWLRGTAKRVIERQKKVEWTTPMGWPMQLGSELEGTVSTRTALQSTPRMASRRQEVVEGELSARATNRGMMANLVHSFDAAYCHAIVCKAEEQGAQLLTNHDCFAAIPARAGWLHAELHSQLRELYKTDWLANVMAEIQARAGIKKLPAPPMSGDLLVGLVGQNPYCFS